MLSGLLRCATCGGVIVGQTVYKPRQRQYSYYYCTKYNEGNSSNCPVRRTNREALDAKVLESVQENVLKPESIGDV